MPALQSNRYWQLRLFSHRTPLLPRKATDEVRSLSDDASTFGRINTGNRPHPTPKPTATEEGNR